MKTANFGQSFKLCFGTYSEGKMHPHVPEEKADLFSTINMGSTEVETINFINAIVYSFKPKIALETGTHFGSGAIAIANALEANGFGKLITIEPYANFVSIAKNNLQNTELLHRVDIIQDYSFNFIESYKGEPFDFVFFDSDASRAEEFNMILRKNLFSENAVCIFHDTSAKRHLTFKADPEYVKFMSELLEKYEGFCFPYSRGFHFFRISPTP